jgi:hypothetical protein
LKTGEDARPGFHEVVLVWALFAGAALVVLITYARLPPGQLYNVGEGGGGGGAGRALVFVNYPVALAAVAVIALVVERLRRTWATAVAGLATALCAVVVWPGVVDQADLDAKPANAIPAAGVVIAVALTGLALRRGGLGASAPASRLNAVRLGLVVVLLAAAIPWGAAELGFSPDLKPIFLTGQPSPEPGHPELIAVHKGHHHGTDGTLLAFAALALSRQVGRVRSRLHRALALYLALMLVYGLANALQDFWLEQIVKRGATSAELPSMLRPSLSPAWAAILATALLIHLAASRVGTFRWFRTGGSQ